MTFTYSTLLLTDRDQIRLWTGDTNSLDPQMQDEEIAFFLSDEGNSLRAAAACAEAIAAKYARQVDLEVAKQVRQNLSQRQEQYLTLAKRLRAKSAQRSMAPLAGGLSVSQKEQNRENTDLVQPYFTRDQMEEPGTDVNDPFPSQVFPIPQ